MGVNYMNSYFSLHHACTWNSIKSKRSKEISTFAQFYFLRTFESLYQRSLERDTVSDCMCKWRLQFILKRNTTERKNESFHARMMKNN